MTNSVVYKNYRSLGLFSFLSCRLLAPLERLISWPNRCTTWVITQALGSSGNAPEISSQNLLSYRESEDYQNFDSLKILGIDPGLSGAIALIEYFPDTQKFDFVDIWDMPTKDGKAIQVLEFAKIVKELIKDKNLDSFIAVIERVGEMPTKQDPLRAFKFGFSTGVLHAVLRILGVRISAVKPLIWKSALGLSADKKQSIEKAKRIFPSASGHLTRAKDHDRAEALLLAYYLTTLLKRHNTEKRNDLSKSNR